MVCITVHQGKQLKAFIGLLANNTAKIGAENFFILFAKGFTIKL